MSAVLGWTQVLVFHAPSVWPEHPTALRPHNTSGYVINEGNNSTPCLRHQSLLENVVEWGPKTLLNTDMAVLPPVRLSLWDQGSTCNICVVTLEVRTERESRNVKHNWLHMVTKYFNTLVWGPPTCNRCVVTLEVRIERPQRTTTVARWTRIARRQMQGKDLSEAH